MKKKPSQVPSPILCPKKKDWFQSQIRFLRGLVWLRFENHQEQKRFHLSWLTYYSTKLLNLTALVVKDYFALYPAGSFPAAAGASRLSLPTSASCLASPWLLFNSLLFPRFVPFASFDLLQLPQHPLDLLQCAGVSGVGGIQYWAPFRGVASGVSNIVQVIKKDIKQCWPLYQPWPEVTSSWLGFKPLTTTLKSCRNSIQI